MNLTNCGVSLISPMMFKRFKLFIWDFDDTLINTTAYYTRDMEPMSIRKRTDSELLQDILAVQGEENWKPLQPTTKKGRRPNVTVAIPTTQNIEL